MEKGSGPNPPLQQPGPGAGITAFRGLTSLRPAPLLNLVVSQQSKRR